MTVPSPRACIYCGEDKASSDFSDEHIWPDALGGDFLPPFWRTTDVCRRCNSLSGVFVDGSFIRSWIGAAERFTGALDYVDVSRPGKTVLPLNYMGRLSDKTEAGEVAELWLGPCGANIVHVRPSDAEDIWDTYAGGDPRKKNKRVTAGRAYMALTSSNEFWILASLASFRAHFRKAELFITNLQIPAEWKAFKAPNLADDVQAADMGIVEKVLDAGRRGTDVKAEISIKLDLGQRLLAKLGLAVGYKLFGRAFLDTPYAGDLRRGFREADSEKRRMIPVRGTGFLEGEHLSPLGLVLTWPGAWVLKIMIVGTQLALSVVSPSGRSMSVQITDDVKLISGVRERVGDGEIWVTVPSLGQAVGPIPLPDYLAHRSGQVQVAELAALQAARIDTATLPSCC